MGNVNPSLGSSDYVFWIDSFDIVLPHFATGCSIFPHFLRSKFFTRFVIVRNLKTIYLLPLASLLLSLSLIYDIFRRQPQNGKEVDRGVVDREVANLKI